jgi:hypothetical protein
LRVLIRAGSFPPVLVVAATPADLTFTTVADKWRINERDQQSDNQKLN